MKRIACAGAPRDLGRDQGATLGAEIRAAVGCDRPLGRLRALRSDGVTQRLARDLRRYFPHQAEWLEGMARAARVPKRALLRRMAASAVAEATPAIAAGVDGDVRVACRIPPRAVLRTVRPEGRFASVEVALPAAIAPLAGVNEAGLAVAAVAGRWRPGRFAPPVALFTRDCLERFERVEPALEWCLSRPAADGGTILLADARGDRVGVDASAPGRRAIAPVDGWLAPGLAPGLALPALSKRADLTGADLEAALLASLATAAPAGSAALVLDPGGRRLRVAGGEWIPAPRESGPDRPAAA